MCLRKSTFHYVLKEMLYKNFFSLIKAVTLFMKFLCVFSEVNTETRFVSRKNQLYIFLDYMNPGYSA